MYEWVNLNKLSIWGNPMAMNIKEDCIACSACLPEYPADSISESGSILYVIDAAPAWNASVVTTRPNAFRSVRWIASLRQSNFFKTGLLEEICFLV